MSKEITVREEAAIVHRNEAADNVLEVIRRAAADPSVNVDKLERLLDIQERLLTDGRRTAFMAALARLQAELPQIEKTGIIADREGKARNRFARLEDIDHAIRPLCAREGFSFSFDSKETARGIEFSCTLAHRDGHSEVKTLTLPVDTGAGRNAVQSVGSTTSYARRYLLSMHLHLITKDEDNDGNFHALVTPEQAERLRSELGKVGGSEEKFLRWLGVGTFDDIPAAQFTRAIKFIEEKGRRT